MTSPKASVNPVGLFVSIAAILNLTKSFLNPPASPCWVAATDVDLYKGKAFNLSVILGVGELLTNFPFV